jgi:hypothetical protein
MVQIKTRFETSITKNDVYGINLIHLFYLKSLMAYLCSQRTPNFQIMYFMFAWSIYRLFVLNRGWNRDSPQIEIFVYVCSTWRIFELKNRFETWITTNDVNGVCLFHSSYLISLKAYQSSQRTPNFQIKCFMFAWTIYRLFVLNRGRKRDPLQIIIFSLCLFDMQLSWTNKSIWNLKSKMWRKCCKFLSPFLFNNT